MHFLLRTIFTFTAGSSIGGSENFSGFKVFLAKGRPGFPGLRSLAGWATATVVGSCYMESAGAGIQWYYHWS